MTDSRLLLETARRVCTPAQLEVYELAAHGLSERAIALALDLSRSAVRSRLENARHKIRQETDNPTSEVA